MIDNIRFYFTFKPDENWLTKLQENITLKDGWSNAKAKTFTGKLFLDKKVQKLKNNKSKPSLLIEIQLFKESGEAKILVKNSLRKWFFDTEVLGDFNKSQFEECLNLLSKKLIVNPEILFGAKVTRVEYGANLKFRDEYKCFTSCIHSHFDLKNKCTFGDETVEFRGENRSVIFYDKISEQKGKTFKAANQKKLNNVMLLLRYEIKVKKLSNSIETPLMSYLHDIIKNWNIIVDLWRKEIDKITFTNSMNPKIYDYLKDAKIKPMTQYLVYLGMEHLGLEDWRLILSDRMYSKIRKTTMDSQLRIYNDFKAKIEEENFEYLFKLKVEEMAGKLNA